MKVSASIFLILILSSCQDDLFSSFDSPNTVPYPEVDQRLWTYFESFENEAQKRGLYFDLKELEITGVIENIAENGVAGTCQYGNHLSHVTVDEAYWDHSSQINREFVVFHELGHCVLYRGHEESEFNNGICISIMSSGTGSCINAYSGSTRSYYLDELFSSLLKASISENS